MCTLEVQLDVVLPGDRDAAVHLDRLGGHLGERLAGGEPGQCGRRGRRLGDRVVDDRPRRLHRDVQVGHPVLERLEAADRAAELHAVLGVFDGQVQALGGGADLLGGQQDRGDVGEPGSAPRSAVSFGSNRASRRVRSMVSTGCRGEPSSSGSSVCRRRR